jgi:membrane-bound ClpP family serine protease
MSEKKKKKRQKISVEEIPANVMETVDRVMPGGTIEKAGKWEKKDKVAYMVKKSVEEGKYVITVNADGVLLAVVREDFFRRRWKRRGHRKGSHKHHGHKHHKGHHKKGKRE